MPRAYGTHLYLIRGAEWVKVGRSKHCDTRLREIQQSVPWCPLELLHVYPGLGALEPAVHRALAAYERKAEWFRCAPEDTQKAVENARV